MSFSALSKGLSNTVMDFVASLSGFGQALQIRWFDSWHGVLDDALREPLDFGGYPPELWRMLGLNRAGAPKKMALVTDKGTPVALVLLRRNGHHWEPATQFLLPGIVFPTRGNSLLPVMAALSVDLDVAWWRMGSPPPQHEWIRSCVATPTHRMDLSTDIEAYWRDSGRMKDVRQARNRSRNLSCVVDMPGGAEWTIRNWAEKWSAVSGNLMPEVADRVVVADCLAAHGQHHALLLLDGDKPVAGATLTVHGTTVVAGVLCREPEYERQSVGTRIIDLSFQWALENGYQVFDIGGGHDYKHGWAPVDGERWQLRICPPFLFGGQQVIREARALGRNIMAKARR